MQPVRPMEIHNYDEMGKGVGGKESHFCLFFFKKNFHKFIIYDHATNTLKRMKSACQYKMCQQESVFRVIPPPTFDTPEIDTSRTTYQSIRIAISVMFSDISNDKSMRHNIEDVSIVVALIKKRPIRGGGGGPDLGTVPSTPE